MPKRDKSPYDCVPTTPDDIHIKTYETDAVLIQGPAHMCVYYYCGALPLVWSVACLRGLLPSTCAHPLPELACAPRVLLHADLRKPCVEEGSWHVLKGPVKNVAAVVWGVALAGLRKVGRVALSLLRVTGFGRRGARLARPRTPGRRTLRLARATRPRNFAHRAHRPRSPRKSGARKKTVPRPRSATRSTHEDTQIWAEHGGHKTRTATRP